MQNTEAIAMISMFTVGGYVLRTLIVSYRRQRTAKLQADVMTKLIDRIGSSPELGKWLESGGPRQFLEFEAERSSPHSRILNSIQTGLVALSLGCALMWVGKYEEVSVAGTILAAVGIGFLTSAAAAYVLSKSWGILKTDAERAPQDVR